MRALADTFFPPAPDAPAGSEVVPELLDDLLAGMDPEEVKQLGIGLALLDAGALPRYGRRFSRLGPADRVAYLTGWRGSRLHFRRNLYRVVRTLVTNLYYSDARSWPALGYAGPRVPRSPS